MDRLDDLGAVDALEVDAGDPQIAMPELPLDDHQRDALVGELDSVGMPQLMRRKAPTDARRFRRSTQLLTRAEASQRLPAVGPWMTQNSAPTGRVARISRYEVN